MKFKSYIAEMFDSPWTKEYDKGMTKLVSDHLASHPAYKGKSFVNVAAYKLEGKNGHIISFIHNKMLEVHHLDANENSGSVTNKTKINPKFITTMFHHAKELALGKSKPVRLSLSKPIYDSVSGIVDRLAKKHNYSITHKTENIMGNEMHHIEIFPNGGESILGLKEALDKKIKAI